MIEWFLSGVWVPDAILVVYGLFVILAVLATIRVVIAIWRWKV